MRFITNYFYHRFIFYSLLFSPFLIGNIVAQHITPSDRVTLHVNVRENPDTQSDIVGMLRANDTAELLESIRYWYKIKLDGQIIGFVSKAWTRVTDAVPDPATTNGKTDLIVGSWNIKWFGYYNVDKRNYPEMANIIQKMDIIAIQELRGDEYKDRLDTLVSYLAKNGFKYNYLVSQPTGYFNHPDKNDPIAPKGDYIERYGFLWDIDRIDLVNPQSPFSFVSTPIINNAVFRQVPIYSDFKVSNGNGFDFRILTIHTVFKEKINEVRRDEIQFINDWIIDQVGSQTNLEKNIIAIGDFNANPKNQPSHFADIVSGTTDYRVLFEEPLSAGENSLKTTIQQKSNPGPGYFEKPVYDHALVSNETSYALPSDTMKRAAGDLGIVEFDQEDKWKQLNNWYKVIRAMSDHRPIWFKLNYDAQDFD
ncbi:MAG: SH3 domain-containing protein [Bacteroidetes bacterium]|nr:SH3 domain-containing protein [Bacteroidota bacterium]